MTRKLEGLEEGPKADIRIDLLKTTLKKIHLHSQQTSIRNEQMNTQT